MGLEKGSAKNPYLELVSKLAQYFSVSVGFLAGEESTGTDKNQAVQAFAGELSKKNLSDSDLELLKLTADTLSRKNQTDDQS